VDANRGHTLVELVSVLVLLGIVSVVALARTVEPGAFRPAEAARLLLGEARIAQATALGHAGTTRLRVTRGADELLAVVEVDGGEVARGSADARGLAVSVTAGAATGPVEAGDALEVDYDRLGDAIAVRLGSAVGDPAGGIVLSIAGTSSRTLCIAPTGYPHPGACL
jgi:MSHA pilin protein MshC